MALRPSLLGGTALCLLLAAGPLGAQESGTGGTTTPTGTPTGTQTTGAPAGTHSGAAAPARPGPSAAFGGLVGSPADRNAPVTFTADQVDYDDNSKIVTATGHVEAWQNEQILRADKFTYNRDTGVATAEGNVQLLQPDGQVLFADRAELTGNMKDGVLEGMSALLAQNGKLVANGARRTDRPGGAITDMARPVYSACNLCAEDPTRPPLWQIQSRLATRDEEAQRIRFRDAQVRLDGWPVFYSPYLSMPDPSAPRSSGFLSPSFGQTSYLGGFVELPYYWAIDGSSDLTLTPTISTRIAPSLAARYRQRFNFGQIDIQGSVGELDGSSRVNNETGAGGHIFGKGTFNIDENWRVGFNVNRATSESYLRAFRFPTQRVLTSNIYAEGFWGTDTYAKIDSRAYQGLRDVDDVGQIPYALPTIYFEHAFRPDSLGGLATIDTSNYNLFRTEGADTRRLATRLTYDLPRYGALGDLWTLRFQGDAQGYSASDFNEAPFYASVSSREMATANVRAAIDWRMPFIRSAGAYGSQLIEPHVQIVTGPATGRQTLIPNEDSLDFEFSDANLFSLNRFTGRDRQEGGSRIDAALRSAWFFPNGGQVEGLVGQSYRASKEEVFATNSGLRDEVSDVVARIRVSPTPWLSVIGRGRFDKSSFDRQMVDVSSRLDFNGLVGIPVSTTAGYFYSVPQTYLTPSTYRREVYGSANVRVNQHWSTGAFGRYDLELKRGVSVGANLTYEDECLIFDTRFYKSYAEQSSGTLYPSSTTLLIRVGFKTLGDFGFRAL
ncbi:LPS assembly protein LptD [Roseomonas gilardii subsp. gilardii]|uniref:LPS-assembly protein LptD n=1 Tax=Roseomonas gilardii TaxID=257708 RepID=UPI001FF95751|nr:LPS assembly protein LptD [Roseomonas gilardii]UPG74134.1 LPS assembly protein LptD [Roseomonas gilardii subsp. gilardii]